MNSRVPQTTWKTKNETNDIEREQVGIARKGEKEEEQQKQEQQKREQQKQEQQKQEEEQDQNPIAKNEKEQKETVDEFSKYTTKSQEENNTNAEQIKQTILEISDEHYEEDTYDMIERLEKITIRKNDEEQNCQINGSEKNYSNPFNDKNKEEINETEIAKTKNNEETQTNKRELEMETSREEKRENIEEMEHEEKKQNQINMNNEIDSDTNLKELGFFGEQIKMKIPVQYIDISKFRIIPDNQEVYAHKHKERSIIIEILLHENLNKEEIGVHYFEDLASVNESTHNQILVNEKDVFHPQKNYSLIVGEQKIQKIGYSVYDHVYLFMGIFAHPQHNADILVTWNLQKENEDIKPQLKIFKEMLHSFRIVNFSLFQ